jgi:hypothetical protein
MLVLDVVLSYIDQVLHGPGPGFYTPRTYAAWSRVWSLPMHLRQVLVLDLVLFHLLQVLVLDLVIAHLHRKKRFGSFPSPAGMSLPNSPWAGITTSYGHN